MFPAATRAPSRRAASRIAHGRARHVAWSSWSATAGDQAVALRPGGRPATAGSPADTAVRARPARPPASTCCKTAADPTGRTVLGTLNNCAGGTTPWGTVLSGEENFNQYFAARPAAEPTPRHAVRPRPPAPPTRAAGSRSTRASTLAPPSYANEANRFGWIVEIDPFDPSSTPRKHTALGRFKHEGANVIVGRDGRVVAYMGDDERFDYLYKFVSASKFRRATRGGPRAQPDAAGRGRPLRRQVRPTQRRRDRRLRQAARRRRVRRHRRVDPAGSRTAASMVAGHDRRGGAGLHPAGRRRGRRHQDGPPRGRRAQPGQPARSTSPAPTTPTAARPARRAPTRPTRATPTSDGHIVEITEDRRRPPADDLHLDAAAGLRRPGRRPATYFAGFPTGPGLADLLPGQRRLRLRRQPVDLHRRRRPAASATTTACSGAARRARSAASVRAVPGRARAVPRPAAR